MISKRLKAIADFLDINDFIVDVGTDHALLPIYLIKNNLVNGIIATDINKSALNNAITNIYKARLQHKISTVLSDGLENVDINLVNTIVISGMGTKNIIKILKNKEKTKNINKIIVQSNNNYYHLRKNITAMGFYIADEDIVFDNKNYYLTVLFKKGHKKYKDKDFYWGIIKPGNINYYKSLQKNYNDIFRSIPNVRISKKVRMLILVKQLNKIINYCRNYL